MRKHQQENPVCRRQNNQKCRLDEFFGYCLLASSDQSCSGLLESEAFPSASAFVIAIILLISIAYGFDINIVLAECLRYSIVDPLQEFFIETRQYEKHIALARENRDRRIFTIEVISKLHGILPGSIELDLWVPTDPKGIVVLAHGGGSNRSSPRNQVVARSLSESGFATLLLDLLDFRERIKDQSTYEYRFNIPLLSERLDAVIRWLVGNEKTSFLPIGLFGTSTGAAAALNTASSCIFSDPAIKGIKAVVSRGGRLDLVKSELLQTLETPTLFIIGGNDKDVIRWTNRAFRDLWKMKEKKMAVVPRAGHLFEERGALEQVSKLTVDWFKKFLTME